MGFFKNGNYPSEKIDHNNRIDYPKYLNRNQALFERKSHDRCVIPALQYFRHSDNLGN